ncbi:MAG: peptidoglycan DD-metalloendopeptidase family protein, partial [Bacteroidales bacterium]|nr:peptidoglycan DD-metalloendopeptidase family protein [Bacteroidales bacterium]
MKVPTIRSVVLSCSGFFSWILLFSLLLSSPAFSQNKKAQLQENKKKIEEEIEYNSKLLEETQKSKESTLNQLVILKNQISSREKLIKTIEEQIENIDNQIDLNAEIIKNLKEDLKNLKNEYADMIYYAYKNRNAFDRLMFVFASSDFNQAYKRLKYFQQYTAYRKTQAQLIVTTQNEIQATLDTLQGHKQEKTGLLLSLKDERDQLQQTRNQQNTVYKTLSSKEKKLVNVIRDKEKAAKKLQSEIEKIIAEEIRLAANKSGTTATGTFALTPAEMELSANFKENQGGLPWPLEKGIISGTFGEHPHPVFANVKTKNNGIDILTDEKSKARAVFSGEVTRVMTIPNYNYVVMIRHGEYLSVYSNLDEVFVTKGQKIETKQE